MFDALLDSWEFLVAVIGGAVGFWRFLATRKSELAWKRTEFLFDKARYLDTDPDVREILMILQSEIPSFFAGDDVLVEDEGSIKLIEEPDVLVDYATHKVSLYDVLIPSDTLEVADRRRYLFALEKFLNFFDRMQYAVFVSKTLSLDEMRIFGWYLDAVLDIPLLNKYCRASGFQSVVELAQKLSDLIPEPLEEERDLIIVEAENKEHSGDRK